MAGKKKITNELALLPNATLIKVEGMEVVIPTTRDENALQAIILAATHRALIARSIKKWITDEQWPSPKDLKDIAGAIKDTNESCGAIFEKIELPVPPERQAEKQDSAIDFTVLDVKNDDKPRSNQADPHVPSP